jgi:hypothetical protein
VGDVRRRSPTEANNIPPTEPTCPKPPPLHPPVPPPQSRPIQQLLGVGNTPEKNLSKYELAAKKIEKFTSIVIPTLFIVFNFIYWPWLIESANYYDHKKYMTVYHAI